MKQLEDKVENILEQYLLDEGEIVLPLPETPDIYDCWPAIGEAYMPDGIREFSDYPLASLGWIMYVGMAVAKLWDDDWEIYSHLDNLYLYLRDKSGYDSLDEYIRGPILGLAEPQYSSTEALVQECAQRTHSLLMHEGLEPGTEAAFRGYVACLRQLYRMGAAVQLHRLGYHLHPLR